MVVNLFWNSSMVVVMLYGNNYLVKSLCKLMKYFFWGYRKGRLVFEINKFDGKSFDWFFDLVK